MDSVSRSQEERPRLGAVPRADGACDFCVWAPRVERMELHLLAPRERIVELAAGERGYYAARVPGVGAGTRYAFRINRQGGQVDRPDPASRFQPEGVHRPSEVVDPAFPWEDAAWRGQPLEEYVLYEIHVGTFTPEGTFEAVIPRLDALRDLGVTAIELMPVAQFPGGRNWGYDGVHPFAAQNTYGGPAGLKRLVNACHARGLAVVLDVVYNHLGPEGNYLAEFGPYFTERYRTPWGPAVNFDGAHSDEVRRYFIENALDWVTDFHIDGLRLDAIHAIYDASAYPFLAELGEAVHARAAQLGRTILVMPESDRNDSRIIRAREQGGCGLDAQWNDDYHHSVHVLLTGERQGYYEDFGQIEDLAKAFREGYVFSGQYSAYRHRRHGSVSADLPGRQFIVFAQNHDQVGNRRLGERLSQLVPFEAQKLAAGVVLLAPFVPLLFMGEEYGETAPFLYFVSHADPGLIEAVRRGRREEFARFHWQGEVPDPQDEKTFQRSKLNWELQRDGSHRVLREFYRALLQLRHASPALARLDKESMEVTAVPEKKLLAIRRWQNASQVFAAFHFGGSAVEAELALPAGGWRREMDSADARWQGKGTSMPEQLESAGRVALRLPAFSFAVYSKAS
jgi:maltooligosyltrehalose trehalohydrolase